MYSHFKANKNPILFSYISHTLIYLQGILRHLFDSVYAKRQVRKQLDMFHALDRLWQVV